MAPDRISNLPDSILCHILSFIPTKQAAATSILSTSWKSIWLSALTLDFEDKTFNDFISFRNAVYRSFAWRKTTLPILSFRIKCSNKNSPNCPNLISKFVYIAMQRNIENLKINVATEFSPCILTCKTLKVLKLKRLKIVEDFSHQLDLPLLKTLHLSKVYFKHHEYLVKFLSCCPILEDLQLKYLTVPDYDVAKEKFKTLPNLIKARVSYYHDSISFTLVCNVKSLHIEFCKWKCCTKLPMFHNLTDMELKFSYASWTNSWWNWLLEMLECCPKLQHFTIEDNVNELGNQSWKDPPKVPKCVSSELRTCCIGGYNGKEFELQFAKYIMQNSKVLHTMTVKCTSSVDMNDMRQIFMKSFSPARDSSKCKLLFVQ
ncbi:F-box/FBD/LRR-repeat protein At4g00160-like [Trifolium pratense]|uniref:F-box/FBD/LRR-repeat protein At4g00160-like n=1 Tax=Trifolium pratense TaxID=57577 RepID=UPI001E69460A|nr:F-box/FBD/LRR-repeat protein At4g00160-like [Trifolium pratense]